jgi:hypothetical protein
MKIKKNNNKLKIIITFIFIIVTLTSTLYYIDTSLDKKISKISKIQSEEYLQSISKLRKGHIETYIDMMKLRMVDFSSDGKIKECLFNLANNLSSGCSQDEFNKHLIIHKLPIMENLLELVVLDLEGTIQGSTNSKYLGINRREDTYFVNGKKKPYFNDLYFSEITKEKQFIVSAPIVFQDKVIGVVAGRIEPKEFYKIIQDNIDIIGNLYITNKNAELINPSKHLTGKNRGVLTQIVDTKNFIECQNDILKKPGHENHIEKNNHKSYTFKDYRGIEVLGTHEIIEELEWCILSEIEENKNNERIENIRIYFKIISIFGLIIFTTLGYMLGRKLTRENKEIKKLTVK